MESFQAAFGPHAKEILADALDQPAAERDAFVRGRCPDPAMLAELRALLREYEEAPDFRIGPSRLASGVSRVISAKSYPERKRFPGEVGL